MAALNIDSPRGHSSNTRDDGRFGNGFDSWPRITSGTGVFVRNGRPHFENAKRRGAFILSPFVALVPSQLDVFEQMSAMLLYRQSLGGAGALPSTDRIKEFEQALQPAYAPFKPLSTKSLMPPTDSSSTSHYAFLRAYQHTALIYLYREVCGLSTSHPVVQQHVDACLDTINMISNSSEAINCLVFPLCVAGSHSLAVPRQRQILKMLLAVQNEMRFTSLHHLIEFLEGCWRVNPEERLWLETFTTLNPNIINF
ncbi:unnamed protein product [Clonostachys rhizophaga]|uniref:Uncharacterized protein n=1 Tax=Clonostachys rhizophaga TaxID=160324 RepID=A0A9N9YHD2_9HYPO|nr:unnamed protein product [Clonostachys rhizophaga]